MESKSENTKLYKQLRAEHLVLKQQFEILQETFGKALTGLQSWSTSR